MICLRCQILLRYRPYISSRMKCAGCMARMEVRRGTYGVLVGKPQGIPLGRPRRKRGGGGGYTVEVDIKEKE
jgi:hypothetical protein